VNQLFSSGYYTLINLPTWINGKVSTLIDNINTNVIDVDTKNGIIINDISDHLPVYTIVKYSTCKIHFTNKLPIYKKDRLLKESNIEMLLNRLRDLDWTEVTNCNDVNTAYSTSHCMFTEIFNICCPIIQMNANCKSNHKTWLTPSLVNACKKKNNLDKVFYKWRSKEAETKYSVQK